MAVPYEKQVQALWGQGVYCSQEEQSWRGLPEQN